MPRILFGLLSLVPTPLLVFVSSSNKLYIRNRVQLNDQPEVLLPFLQLFLITLAVGVVLYFLSKYVVFRYALWSYYLIGPFFLAFQFLRGATETLPFLSWLTHTEPGGWILSFLFAVPIMGLGRNLRPPSAV